MKLLTANHPNSKWSTQLSSKVLLSVQPSSYSTKIICLGVHERNSYLTLNMEYIVASKRDVRHGLVTSDWSSLGIIIIWFYINRRRNMWYWDPKSYWKSKGLKERNISILLDWNVLSSLIYYIAMNGRYFPHLWERSGEDILLQDAENDMDRTLSNEETK